jgi:hypothetical protein
LILLYRLGGDGGGGFGAVGLHFCCFKYKTKMKDGFLVQNDPK